MATPDFAVQGTDLPKGSGEDLATAYELAASAPEQGLPVGAVPETEPAPEVGLASNAVYPDQGDPTYDAVLLGPTDYPERPITHGLPGGPGADYFPLPGENDDTFMRRIATNMLENARSIPDEATIWAARVIAGE